MSRKSKKMSSKKLESIYISDENIENMEKDQLQKLVYKYKKDLLKENKNYNFLLLEKNQIVQFWELTKQQLEDARSLLRKKEKEMEENDENNQRELTIYRQKVKQLMFDHNFQEFQTKKEAIVDLNTSRQNAKLEIRSMHDEFYVLKSKLRQQEIEFEEVIKNLKKTYELEISRIRQDILKEKEDVIELSNKKINFLRNQLDTQRLVQVHMVEEQKHSQIQRLELNHEQAFVNMKAYYSDITLGNLNVIKTLNVTVDDLRIQLARSQNEFKKCKNELEDKTTQLTTMQKENKHLKEVERQFNSAKNIFQVSKINEKKTSDDLINLQDRYDILYERFKNADDTRQEGAKQFERLLIDIQKQLSLRSLILEKKIQHFYKALEERDAQMQQLIIAMKGDPESIEAAKNNLKDMLEDKNKTIEKMKFEITRISKCYNELKSSYDQKMSEPHWPNDFKTSPLTINNKFFKTLNKYNNGLCTVNEKYENIKTHSNL